MDKVFTGDDGKARCQWCSATSQYQNYHDDEWGIPIKDDFRLFEKICLEGFQSGLSWRTILEKRANFRAAFAHFDFNKVALFNQDDVERLVTNAGIIRHRGKIEAAINNAKRALEVVDEFGSLAHYFWQFEPKHQTKDAFEVRATSDESIALSKDLKKRGWKFVGPTTMYAFMQAMGLINDHAPGCYAREAIFQKRSEFECP